MMQKYSLSTLFLIAIIFCSGILVYASTKNAVSCQGGEHLSCRNLNIQVKDHCISLDIKNQPLDCVLNQVGRQAGICIRFWEESRKPVTLCMANVPLTDFFRRLGADNALVYQYIPGKKEFQIIAANIAVSGISTLDTRSGTRPGTGSGIKITGKNRLSVENRSEENRSEENRSEEMVKPGELIVRFKEHVSKNRMNRLHQFLGSKIIEQIDSLSLHRIRLDSQLSIKTAMEMYLATDLVKSAQGNGLRTPHGYLPNDLEFTRQWGLTAIKAPDAWEISQGSEEVVIAVIDTGVDFLHPDLQKNIWINQAEAHGLDGVDDDQNGYIDDIYGWDFAGAGAGAGDDNQPFDLAGHGTHIAGIIGAVTDNSIGIAGVCPKVKIMVLKVQGDTSDDMETFDIIQAIEYAKSQGVHIINCSFGGDLFQEEEYNAFERFQNANNGLIICSAGNDGKNTDITPLYPAGYDLPGIISVGASTENLPNEYSLADFSNFGSSSVDVMAPGDDIFSTIVVNVMTQAYLKIEPSLTQYPADGFSYAVISVPQETGLLLKSKIPTSVTLVNRVVNNTTLYGSMDGTSMAAGFVSGAAGLLHALSPNEDFTRLKEILLNTVDIIDSTEGNILSKGQINIFKALAALPLPGDVNKDHKLTIEDSIIGLKILSGKSSDTISQDIPHWDVNNDNKLGFPESIHLLQQLDIKD